MSKMPPVPPANRSTKGSGRIPTAEEKIQDASAHEHHANDDEKAETANVRQNTTNKGFFRGRRGG